jgi:hypothetical protein
MIQMSVGEKDRVECEIRSCRWPIQRLRFFAALKQTAINQDPRLFCPDDVTRTGYFAASRANEGDFHRDSELVILGTLEQARLLDFRLTKALSVSPRRGASIRSGNWLSGFAAMGRRQA